MVLQLMLFQSREREIDLVMTNSPYSPFIYEGSDFIGPITTWDFHFISASPKTKNNYLTLFRPFDSYVWGLLLASITAVSLSLATINKMHSKWSKLALKETPVESINIFFDMFCVK